MPSFVFKLFLPEVLNRTMKRSAAAFLLGALWAGNAFALSEVEWIHLYGKARDIFVQSPARAEEAKEVLRAKIKETPNDPIGHQELGELCLLVAGKVKKAGGQTQPHYQEALKELNTALPLLQKGRYPRRLADCYVMLAVLYKTGFNDPAKAIELYRKAAQADPENVYAIYGLKEASATPATSAPTETAGAAAKPSSPFKLPASTKTPTHKVILKNGFSLECAIVEKDAKGIWVEAGAGTRTYLKNEEVKKIVEL